MKKIDQEITHELIFTIYEYIYTIYEYYFYTYSDIIHLKMHKISMTILKFKSI
jgi:hypothetical protein